MRPLRILSLLVILAAFAAGAWAYPQLPERFAAHWNVTGAVTRTVSRGWGVAFGPLLMLVLWALFVTLPRYDTLQKNVAANLWPMDAFICVLMSFLAYIYGLALAWNLGMRVDLVEWLLRAFALLFILTGAIMPRLRRNWFYGIRTPWTLSNDLVWEESHRLGGWAFKAAGVAMLFGEAWREQFAWFVLLPIIVATLYCVVVSYQLYAEHQAKPGK